MILQLAIVAMSLIGAGIALHIFSKKRAKKKLICPLRMSCDTVTESQYGSFLGIPVELLGSFYYLFTAVVHILIMFGIVIGSPFLFIIALIAALFSLYLIYVEAFVLHAWCSWCLASAIIAVLIFLVQLK